MKKLVKIHYVVNGHNLVWPTYAVTLEPGRLKIIILVPVLPWHKQIAAYVGQTTVLTVSETLTLTINPRLEDFSNLLVVGSGVFLLF